MNNIPDNQNLQANLEHFAASRSWYAQGKRVADLQTAIAIGLPLIAAIVLTWSASAETKAWITFFSLSAAIVETVLLDPLQQSRRRTGAVEQEMFDCAVLELEWPVALAGEEPAYEATRSAARKFLHADAGLAPFRDWYRPETAPLSIDLGRLACQRGNAWWDSQERTQYATILRWLSVGVVVLVSVIGFARQTQLRDLVSTVYAPLSPLVIWALKERQRHITASQLSARLKAEAEKAWRDALRGIDAVDITARRARDIQNGIFSKRSSAPFLPNWLKRRQHEKYEDQWAAGLKPLLDEARKAGVI